MGYQKPDNAWWYPLYVVADTVVHRSSVGIWDQARVLYLAHSPQW